MRTKQIRFGPGESLESVAPLLMLGSIEVCQPRRRRHRGSGPVMVLSLLATAAVLAWLIVDGVSRGMIPFLPG